MIVPSSPIVYKISLIHRQPNFFSPNIKITDGMHSILNKLDEKCFSYSKRTKNLLNEYSLKKVKSEIVQNQLNNNDFYERVAIITQEYEIAERRSKECFDIITSLKKNNIITFET